MTGGSTERTVDFHCLESQGSSITWREALFLSFFFFLAEARSCKAKPTLILSIWPRVAPIAASPEIFHLHQATNPLPMMDGSQRSAAQCSAVQTQVRPAEQTEPRWSIKLAMPMLRHFIPLWEC